MISDSVITENFRFVEGWVKALVKGNPDRMNFDEYMYIVKLIRQHQPCDMLVFGAGKDGLLWRLTNPDGRLIILENSASLVAKTTREYKILADCVQLVNYSTTVERDMRCTNAEKLRLPDIPRWNWRIIIVDAPKGANPKDPGRMQSIYMSWSLAMRAPDTHVLIHDCDREVEAFCSDWWFENSELVMEIGKLRHYHVQKEKRQSG